MPWQRTSVGVIYRSKTLLCLDYTKKMLVHNLSYEIKALLVGFFFNGLLTFVHYLKPEHISNYRRSLTVTSSLPSNFWLCSTLPNSSDEMGMGVSTWFSHKGMKNIKKYHECNMNHKIINNIFFYPVIRVDGAHQSRKSLFRGRKTLILSLHCLVAISIHKKDIKVNPDRIPTVEIHM